MQRIRWTERSFHFDLPPGRMPDMLERLRGTAVRIESVISGLDEAVLKAKAGHAWSILEHIGHLGDLEELHLGRIGDFRNRLPMLRAADMTNATTETAIHNIREACELIERFRNKRNELVEQFESLDEETMRFSSVHPRLQIPAKPVDIAFFTAEHDDHHLASIRALRDMRLSF